MAFLLKMFLPGHRTITMSVVAGLLAVLLQADSQGILELSPLLKIVFTMMFTIITPMIPVFLRKAYNEALEKGKK